MTISCQPHVTVTSALAEHTETCKTPTSHQGMATHSLWQMAEIADLVYSSKFSISNGTKTATPSDTVWCKGHSWWVRYMWWFSHPYTFWFTSIKDTQSCDVKNRPVLVLIQCILMRLTLMLLLCYHTHSFMSRRCMYSTVMSSDQYKNIVLL